MSHMLKSRNYVMRNSMGTLSLKTLRDRILSIQRLLRAEALDRTVRRRSLAGRQHLHPPCLILQPPSLVTVEHLKCGYSDLTACVLTSLQLCPTLCDPMDCSPPGSSVHRTLQARILGWVAMPSSSRGSSRPSSRTRISCVSCTAGGFFNH